MDLNQLHFAYPLFLWAGIVIPVVGALFFFIYQNRHLSHQLEKYIDQHLIPFLLKNSAKNKKSIWRSLLVWSFLWTCLTIALAGPRWNYREIETFTKDQSLVILLDLSESMNATDINPSRLIRAKQKIEDLINLSEGAKLGLIVFAADPHMISPLTDDKETIRNFLPNLETDLIYIQGSRLSPALDMASLMLSAEPGNNKAVLVISDGGFEDSSAISTARNLALKGIVIYSMGIGTSQGAPIKDHEGNIIKKNGNALFSKLEKERLKEISIVGNGRYFESHYDDNHGAVILKELTTRAEAQTNLSQKKQFWEEHFYLVLFPVLPIMLWWFRRGYIFAIFIIFFFPLTSVQASLLQEYFLNSEQLGQQALDEKDNERASNIFQDSYRKGVAFYKMGNFTEAETMFRKSSRPEVALNAEYNLGNALVQQNKLKEAMAAYENVLKQFPEHTKAKENLELVKKMLEEQKQEENNSENSEKDSNNSDDKDQGEDSDSNESSKDQEHTKKNEKQSNKDKSENKNQNENQENQQDLENDPKEGQDDKQDSVNENNAQNDLEETKVTEKDHQDNNLSKSQEEQDADLWLNRLNNDPKNFLKNKFYLESKRNGTKEGIDPW